MRVPTDDVAPELPLITRLLVRPRAYRHPRAWAYACGAAGLWLLFLGALVTSYGRWWGAAFFVVAALEFWIAYSLLVAPLPRRVRVLERSRAHVVDDSAARLRRIERDLHDGAQAQMVAVAMKLGLAKEKLSGIIEGGAAGDLDRVLDLVVTAHRGATEAIAELRDLARGIHPPVLDHGLGEALASLAAGGDVPVDVVADLAERPSAAIETIAYFCAAELLTNVAKHSDARQARLEAIHLHGLLLVRVTDDGVGGARLDAGGGLAGLADRIQAVDGSLRVSSPAGGPTVVTVELPSHA